MNSRQRVSLALDHREPDRVPLDLGGTTTSGMHVSTVYKLRQALKLDEPGTPVKVVEPFQMLGEIGPDLMDALGVDVVELKLPTTMFGFKNEGWKPWKTFDGTPVLVPGDFNTELEPDGSLVQYPLGDKTAKPSGVMPKDGWYFDAIIRQGPIDDSNLDVADNLEEFGRISSADLEYLKTEAERLYTETDKAIVGNFVAAGFGDIALVPGINLRNPKGIRDVEEWYVSTVLRRDYIYKVFEGQCEIALYNLEQIYKVVGDKISVLFVSGTDFGTQNGPFMSPAAYQDLYKPFHKEINTWIHRNTSWKTFIHSCGSVRALIPDFIDAGFDILNPVQCSAADMDMYDLKREFGDKITFWGGGVDTQRTLPFGNPEDVRREVSERIKAFGPGGGFIFNSIHNIQALTPVENLLAMYETLREEGGY
ncbi:MAG: methyltransferase [Firmicutes bacterium]|nr:methyltransferase [Bacillota bacterium]